MAKWQLLSEQIKCPQTPVVTTCRSKSMQRLITEYLDDNKGQKLAENSELNNELNKTE